MWLVQEVAEGSAGMSGAELANIVSDDGLLFYPMDVRHVVVGE